MTGPPTAPGQVLMAGADLGAEWDAPAGGGSVAELYAALPTATAPGGASARLDVLFDAGVRGSNGDPGDTLTSLPFVLAPGGSTGGPSVSVNGLTPGAAADLAAAFRVTDLACANVMEIQGRAVITVDQTGAHIDFNAATVAHSVGVDLSLVAGAIVSAAGGIFVASLVVSIDGVNG